ncbi:MAG: arsenate reductase (glutaredoxin) [Gammaproteobacteria bacterium]
MNMSVTIYHNPRCSKSRNTLALLEANNITPTVVEYLQTPPDAATLTSILEQLSIGPRELIRKGEDEYKSAKAQLDDMDDVALVEWMTKNPKVIERPVVVTDKGARIGRPPENVLEIL